MNVTSFFRIVAFAVILPAFGVAVAASAMHGSFTTDDPPQIKSQTEPIPAPRSEEAVRANWAYLSGQGSLSGRISTMSRLATETPAEDIQLFLMRDGQVIKTTATATDGSFEFKDVEPGHYSLIGSGRNGFVAYALQALKAKSETDIGTQIHSLAVPPKFSAVNKILGQHFNQNHTPSAEQVMVQISHQSFYHVSAPENLNIEALAADNKDAVLATSIQHHKIPLVDGGVGGQFVQLRNQPTNYRSVNVYLIQNDEQVAHTVPQADGSFSFSGIQPGVYSLVAAGSGGFAAIAFELVESPFTEASNQSLNDVHYVSTAAPRESFAGLNLSMVQEDDVVEVVMQQDPNNQDNNQPPADQPPAPPAGGAGQQPVILGGGGGGGSPLANAGWAGLAGLFGLLGLDDDGNLRILASPFF